jgi:GcrA cell cycle regulator
MEWSEETIVHLRALWAEGLSTAEIGRRLGVSKNAVVGKAHRLDLTARPSPIRREGPGQPHERRSLPRTTGPTLPPLSSAQPLAPMPQPVMVPRPRPVLPAPVRVQPAPARPYGRLVACCWPIGEPGTREFHFCDAESEPGKPYCEEHAKRAYVKLRDRREDAA